MHKPIAVFDAGIGSYAIVAEIQRRLPTQDILYFADRASFPYGGKEKAELAATMRKSIALLETFAPSAIVVASNAPSIMVLDEVRQYSSVPLFGIFPPLQEALAASSSGHVGIMGVRSLVESENLRLFVRRHAAEPDKVALINASPMVELVESGSFLFSRAETRAAVKDFIDEIFRHGPSIDVLTLSSTHLPWLRRFFETARPECCFLDPADKIAEAIGSGTPGAGRVHAIVTESENYKISDFRRMLGQIGVDIPLEVVG